jgi:hypothetical protein
MIGELLNQRYKIQSILGQQAGRKTFLALDRHTHGLVVVKLLLFNPEFEWDDLKLFEREARVLQAIDHPAIPQFLDCFELELPHAKGVALVQSYIEARSLSDSLQGGRSFSEAEIKQLARELLAILHYLHSRHPPIVHRDLKPSNILLGDRSGSQLGSVYLVDFGSVQNLTAREGRTITVVGTYGYMPPEQFGGRTVPASDLYSLGATLIALLTGTHPADLPAIDGRLQFEELSAISPAFARWLRKLVEPSLDRRFPSARAALSALETLDGGSPAGEIAPAPPYGSRIRIDSSIQAIEILIPAKGWRIEFAFVALFAIAWNTFITFWTGFALFIPFPINLLFALFSLPFWGVGLSMLGGLLFGIWGRTRLKIDGDRIQMTLELFNWRWQRPKPMPREEITRVIRQDQRYRRDSGGDRVALPPCLVVQAGTETYQLSDLSEPELDWIGAALSDWLGIKVSEDPLRTY